MKKSTQVAIGGLTAALCLLLMFMTGLIPFSSYVFPAMAGIVLIVVREENGAGTAWLTYVVISILSLLIVPDRQAVMLFILFLGYYPIVKPVVEKFPKPLAYVVKFIFFNVAIIAFYYVVIYVFGIPDLLEDFGNFGKYTAYVALGMADFTFFVYDFLLSNMEHIYLHWFRPKILRKIG
ncbi:hypothetical protein [Youxingia wuxianensis]|uniref:Uncharacterized protein n=1 Tax=Youxingia wuxianensis TaxID=2763678 RepID=A0A926ER63_9FIRM|nr:hypothetical protein [Youxingia wuxianensis]MBC8585019.1 hypothetical protein [Youxingia wuxianensis]